MNFNKNNNFNTTHWWWCPKKSCMHKKSSNRNVEVDLMRFRSSGQFTIDELDEEYIVNGCSSGWQRKDLEELILAMSYTTSSVYWICQLSLPKAARNTSAPHVDEVLRPPYSPILQNGSMELLYTWIIWNPLLTPFVWWFIFCKIVEIHIIFKKRLRKESINKKISTSSDQLLGFLGL